MPNYLIVSKQVSQACYKGTKLVFISTGSSGFTVLSKILMEEIQGPKGPLVLYMNLRNFISFILG